MLEDVADEFSDNSQDEDQDILPPSTNGVLEKSRIIRLIIGLALFFGVFFFIHFHEEYVEVLQLDSNAKSYVVAQIDFDFFDEEKTIILKEASIRDITYVYSIEEDDVHSGRISFERFIQNDQKWQEKIGHSNAEELFKISDQLEEVLGDARFADPRTLQRMKDLNTSTDYYQSFVPTSDRAQVLPSYIWTRISNIAFLDKEFSQKSIDFVVKYFEVRKWQLIEDRKTVRKLRKLIQNRIPDQYTRVLAGKSIIEQGEKVTARHVGMLQAMKKALSDKRNLWYPFTLSGSFLLALIFSFAFLFYLYKHRACVFASNRKLALIVTIILLTFCIAKGVEYVLINNTTNLIEMMRYPLFVPFTAILLCCLMREQTALLASGFVATILPLGLAIGNITFFIINIVPAVIAIFSIRSFRKRKEILIVCSKVWLSSIVMILGIKLYANEVSWAQIDELLMCFAGSGLFMLGTAIFVVGLIPLLEFLFKIATDMTLMEYIDPNNEVLRRLAMEAPGTYQHSVVVSMLAETAAVAIGAHGLFCRVVSLYHDIGKLKYPQYFSENKQDDIDMHQLLTPEESATVILDHVEESVKMARKLGLPERVIDVIHEHHGTTLAYYFYHKQQKLKEKIPEEVKTAIEEGEFRYRGPRPSTKESAIVMLADSLSAAARSLDELDKASVAALMGRLIKEKDAEGQFDRCQLTLEELSIVKESMIKTLVATEHKRVKYPDRQPALDYAL